MSSLEKVLIAGDQQIPYHDPRMVSLYFKVMKAFKPDRVLLTGDTVDFPEYGRWDEGGTKEFLNTLPSPPEGESMLRKVFENARGGREFYEQHRETLPDARIQVALGNHDIRIWNYFEKKAPEILEHITPNSLWGFDDLGIEHIHYNDRPLHIAGGVHMHHGVAISKHAGESVRGDIDNFGVSLIRGHSHRLAQYSKTYQLRNEILTGWEMGHMMDVNCSGAAYDNVHNWQAGFGIAFIEDNVVDTVDGRRMHVSLIPITQDYSCVIGGKVYKA